MNRRDFLKHLSAMGITSCIPINTMAEQKKGFVQFAENNFKLYHYKHGLVPFKTYKYVEELSDLFESGKRVLVNKYRQGGFTAFALAWALYNCLTKENQKFLILFKTDGELCRTVNPYLLDPMCDNLTDEFRLKIRKRNDHTIDFCNGNVINMLTPMGSRGLSCNTLIIDEAAFIQDMDQYYASFYPTVASTDGKIIALSTPNGKSNWFYKNWESGKWTNYSANVHDHPDYNQEKLEEIKSQLGDKGFRQEMLGEFLTSSNSQQNLSYTSTMLDGYESGFGF